MIVIVPTRLEMQRLFPELGAPPLDRGVRAWLPATSARAAVHVAWCGFGLASAGAGAAALLAGRPEEACLVGFSGTLRPESLGVGGVIVATSVECEGVGLPRPSAGAPPAQLDAELASDPSLAAPAPPVVPDALRLALGPEDRAAGMLSVAMPSASLAEARERASAHPDCLAEEMEALAVLHAAEACGRRLVVLRGVTNVAGERDKSAWRVDDAVTALRTVLLRWLGAP